MTATRIIAIIIALLIDVQIVRNAAVLLYAPSKPMLAAKFWPTHPATEISLSTTEIARAARDKRASTDRQECGSPFVRAFKTHARSEILADTPGYRDFAVDD